MKKIQIPDRARPGTILPGIFGVFFAAIALFNLGCSNAVEPKLTAGELIRQVLVSGGDESILFSSAVLADQTGTDHYSRTIDSVHRGFVDFWFYEETTEVPFANAFRSEIMDTLFGSLTFKIEGKFVTRKYAAMAFGSLARLYDNSCFSCPNPWQIWKMRQRRAQQLNGQAQPAITSMSMAGPQPPSYTAAPSAEVRINRDSVLTLLSGTPTSLTVTAFTSAPDDSLFLTYPNGGVYQTVPMTHISSDSLRHTATVNVSSGRRYELVAVQGFKRRSFTDSTYAEITSSVIQTGIMAFR